MRHVVQSFMHSGAAQLAAQIVGLWLVSLLAQVLAALLPMPVPAGAIGLAMLFALLCANVIPLASIERGASLLVRHLGLFLIPYAVSIMAFSELLLASGLALAVSLVGSTAIGMWATGWSAQAAAQAVTGGSDTIGGAKR